MYCTKSLTGTDLYDRIQELLRNGQEFVVYPRYIRWCFIQRGVSIWNIHITLTECRRLYSLVHYLGGDMKNFMYHMYESEFGDSEMFCEWMKYRRDRRTNFSVFVVTEIIKYSLKFNHNPRSAMRYITGDDGGEYLRGITDFIINHPKRKRFADAGKIKGFVFGRQFTIHGRQVERCIESGLIDERLINGPILM